MFQHVPVLLMHSRKVNSLMYVHSCEATLHVAVVLTLGLLMSTDICYYFIVGVLSGQLRSLFQRLSTFVRRGGCFL